jgi:seryl-tRNA synthetase
MLLEQLTAIEDKVARLIQELDRLRQENAALADTLATTDGKARDVDAVREENVLLRRRVEELEIEVSDVTEKEQEIRERLRTIIHKIDVLEGMPENE